jgi:preprotein translocase subunit SecA
MVDTMRALSLGGSVSASLWKTLVWDGVIILLFLPLALRRYLLLAGMTGTAREVVAELWSVYRLNVVTVPPNRPLRRVVLPGSVFRSEEAKWRAVVERIERLSGAGRPVLVGTTSVRASEHLSTLLTAAGISHRVLNARQDRDEAETIAQAGQPGIVTVATNMAGRGTDIKLGPGVAESGGLHVIATERHEAGRIDRQLFGRSGRQGDPGSAQYLVSLEDDLVAKNGWRRLAPLLPGGASTAGSLGRLLFHLSQRGAERRHVRIRRQLLKVDEQIGDMLAFSGRME